MSHTATRADEERVIAVIREMGYDARPIPGKQRTAIGLIGNDGKVDGSRLEGLSGVLQVIHVTQPYKQVSREWRVEPTVIELSNGTRIGGDDVVLMAGPCSVESAEQITAIAHRLRAAGATVLRGGAFKPRTSPYSFRGLGEAALDLLADVRREVGLPVVTEVMDTRRVEQIAEHVDMLQVGARNMQNFSLLTEVGRVHRPVLLKRGLSATIRDLLLAAEYVMSQGNMHVVLCERGIRTFETATRNTFDVSAIPVLKRETHLPVIADPSHAGGRRELVAPLAYSAIAAGADGLLVEAHPCPEAALSDGDQSLDLDEFAAMMSTVAEFAAVLGRGSQRREAAGVA